MPGQPQLDSNPFIGLDATGLTIRDATIPLIFGIPSGLVFQSTDNVRLALRFELDGILAGPLVAIPLPFNVQFFAEQLGGGVDVLLAAVAGVTVPGQLIYDDPLTAASLTPIGLPAGTYKITAVVTFGAGFPFAAFIEGPVIQVF
jgi:hypothetical protein